MGFELGVVVAGPLAPERIVPVTHQLLARWPWLRLPLETAHPHQVVLGSVERTSYMVGSYRHAQLLDEQIQSELVAASAALPDCSLAWVHTDCFGGMGTDDGQVARAGKQVCESQSLSELLGHVGVETSGFFAGFVRDHFGVNVDPRMFEHCLSAELRSELDEDDDPDVRDEPQWIDRMLDALHGERSEVERNVVATLDLRFDDAHALQVLADALALAGDARAEPLALALVGKSSERALAACRTPLERQLAALAQAKPAHHILIDDWWPRVWVTWSGPFVTRLVVRDAVKPSHHDTPYVTDFAHSSVTDVRKLLALPCARYLSARRVTLLHCAMQRDQRGHDLSDFDLDGVNLTSARLGAACLQRTRLARSLLAHAELRDADLRDADLRGADLRVADLQGADLRGAMLRDADLRFADLRNARLDGGALASARTEGLVR